MIGDGQIVYDLYAGILDLIYPPRCLLCDVFGVEVLCENCLNSLIVPVPSPYCLRCGQVTASADCRKCTDYPTQLIRCRSVGVYDGNLADLIHKLKYRDRPMLARPLATLMADYLTVRAELMNDLKFDAIVPVPLHYFRERSRGYNQSAELARHLGMIMEIPVSSKALGRVRNTKPQVGKLRAERLVSLSSAFKGRRQHCAGKTFLLVDDVSTTGSTISECARALTDAGAKAVFAITLAAG